MVAGRDEAALQQIAYWDGGPPSHRWIEIAFAQLRAKPASGPRIARLLALLNVAIYDALVVAWEAKYTYWTLRPFHMDAAMTTVFTTPNYPSFPSGHAGISNAVAEVLVDQFPANAEVIRAKAAEAYESRIWAGIHFHHEMVAGKAIGVAVAQKVLA